jgi:hypothetical protein
MKQWDAGQPEASLGGGCGTLLLVAIISFILPRLLAVADSGIGR